MAAKQAAAGEALAAQINAMSRSEMYDMMSKMKTLIDHDQETVRRMLVDNPDVTRALFRAQVVLGMVKTPKTAQPSDTVQPTAAPTAPSSVKATAPDHVSLPPPLLPANQQSVAQHSTPFPSGPSNVGSTMDLPTMSANPPQAAQAKGYPIHQMPSSIPQSSQHPMTLPHAPPQYSNLPSHMPIVHSQPQQPLQNPGMFNQQFQPPLPQMPRPQSMQSFSHQMHPQVPNSFGLTHGNAPQHILQQQMFHPGGNPQTLQPGGNPQTSFLAGQPPLPSQPPPQLYPASSHYNTQSTTPMQVDRSAPWGRGPEAPAAGSHFPGQLPGLPGQMAQGIGGIQAGQAPLTPEMEKMLVQQVLGMSAEQINMLPPEQRQQVLQLRDMLRQ
ncbi:hypothetical protein SETIT_3G181700v2 [Setaria italica]|uniref:Cleavage stimulation factor subunit 2 hinge domain-containing protein n=1 Tax=Setaria italica TaxID=4555 RepID=K3Z712_SETIT|nr:cleavage stimulation factor subunit 2 isoform X2 [Setaria italica]RCV16974.1 hypothetical protein SETIT_3G181700v2 [Setaria italica]